MIKGDSSEYEILEEACKTLGDDLFTAEIGVRQGKGSQIILNQLIEKKHYLNCIKEIKNTLNEAEKIMHRLPIIIRPILESLKNEILMRIKII